MCDLYDHIYKGLVEFKKLSTEEQDKILYPNGKITFYAGKMGDESRPLFSIPADLSGSIIKKFKK